MEILEMLTNSVDELMLEDLDMFEIELATGKYPYDYKSACIAKIENLKMKMSSQRFARGKAGIKKVEKKKEDAANTSSVVEIDNVESETADDLFAETPKPEKLPEEIIKEELLNKRNQKADKGEIAKYIQESTLFTADVIEKLIPFFKDNEMSAVCQYIPLEEEFMDKFLGHLNKICIAKYQHFSEKFFIKHFKELSTKVVLTEGVNEWAKKENRSKQMETFLRLKGVKL